MNSKVKILVLSFILGLSSLLSSCVKTSDKIIVIDLNNGDYKLTIEDSKTNEKIDLAADLEREKIRKEIAALNKEGIINLNNLPYVDKDLILEAYKGTEYYFYNTEVKDIAACLKALSEKKYKEGMRGGYRVHLRGAKGIDLSMNSSFYDYYFSIPEKIAKFDEKNPDFMVGMPVITDEVVEPFIKKYEINGKTLVSYCLNPRRVYDYQKMQITDKGILINGLKLKQAYDEDIKEQLEEFEEAKYNLKVETIKPEPYQVRIYKYDTKTHKSTLVDEVYKGNRYPIDNILPERQINLLEFNFYSGYNYPQIPLLYEVNSKYYRINCNFKKFDNGEVYYIATIEEYR